MPPGEAQEGRKKPGRGLRSWFLRPHSPTNITFQAELLPLHHFLPSTGGLAKPSGFPYNKTNSPAAYNGHPIPNGIQEVCSPCIIPKKSAYLSPIYIIRLSAKGTDGVMKPIGLLSLSNLFSFCYYFFNKTDTLQNTWR